MKFKAIIYDTQNKEPMETTVRSIHCDKNGIPRQLTAHDGLQYKEFHIFNDNEPNKYNGYKDWTKEYEEETGKAAYEFGGVPKREYVEWLEETKPTPLTPTGKRKH